jgi:hypothetical protein
MRKVRNWVKHITWTTLTILIHGVENKHHKKENIEVMIKGSMQGGVDVNKEKTKYMVVYRHQILNKSLLTDC